MQSGFRAHHSTETALLSLLSDIYTAMDKSHVTLLALIDVSSAFDMMDHEILLQRLETSFGLSGVPLNWFRSYLSVRSQMVVLGDTRSSWVPVQFGVPQGSVLGPLLYILFTADISRLFAKYSAYSHLYADDVQFMVLLLNSLILLHLLHFLLLILTLGCLLIVCHLILPRPN